MLGRLAIYIKNFDWVLFSAALLLVSFGLIELYSIALSQENPDFFNFKKQAVFVSGGIILLFILAFFDYYHFRSFGNYLYIAGALLLVAVLFFGKTVRGTTGWFEIAGLSLQPVELAKLALLVFLARYFSGVSVRFAPFKHLLITGLAVFLLVFLVIRQPDFGSALLLFFIWLFMIAAAGFKKKYFIAVGLFMALAFAASWLFLFADYQKERVLTYFNPEAKPLEQGYNITQAVIAVGSGGLTGRGVGFGSQSQLKFLPESQNDFIFAAIAEELGFLGVCLVVFLFSVLFYRLLIGIKNLNNDFAVYFILGAAALIFIEMFINIGMNVGLLPIIGISLPFVSYGGSALFVNFIMLGVAESIIIRSKMKY